MTLQQLGSLGEFLAAIATLVTLIYLALQIRRNTAVARATGTSEHTGSLNELSFVLARDAQLSSIYFGGLDDPSTLGKEDIPRFDMMVGAYLSCLMQTYHLYNEGALGEGIWTHQLQQLAWLVSQPGFGFHWYRWPRPSEVPFNRLIQDMLEKEGLDKPPAFSVDLPVMSGGQAD